MDLEFGRDDIETFLFKSLSNNHPILRALNSGKLIIFIGAGMSVHLDLPSWREFALRYLDIVYKNGSSTLMNYKTKESLKNEDIKKLLSLCEYIGRKNLLDKQIEDCYKSWFYVDREKVLDGKLYEKLYKLNAIYLTTNYDNALDLIAEDEQIVADANDAKKIPNVGLKKVFFDVNEFNKDILKPQNVIHVHGSIKDIKSMVISYGHYIQRYGLGKPSSERNKKYSEFMSGIFKDSDYVILFLGYGLDEIEILQYLFEERDIMKTHIVNPNNRYLILPCYSDDYLKISYLADYYKDNFGVSIIPCNITDKGYDIMDDVIDHLLKLSEESYQGKDVVTETKEILALIEEM